MRKLVTYATVREGIDEYDSVEQHVECRFINGEKYVGIIVFGGDEESEFTALQIAEMLNDRAKLIGIYTGPL